MALNIKEGKFRGGVKPISLLMLILAFVVTYVAAVTALTPKRYELNLESVADETIYAPRSIEDQNATDMMRESAKRNVNDIFVLDAELAKTNYENAKGYFARLDDIRTQAKALSSDITKSYESALDDEQKQALCQMVTPRLTVEQLLSVLGATDGDLLRLEEMVLPKLDTALSNGLAKNDLERVKETCLREINATTLYTGLKQVGATVINAFMAPTYIVDKAATEAAREKAASSIESVQIKQGQAIVDKGTRVTAGQLELLKELELVRDPKADLLLDMGIAIYFIVVYAIFGMYLYVYRRDVFDNPKKMITLGALIVLTMLISLVTSALNSRITPALIAIILTSVLVCERTALVMTVVMALSIGLMAGGRGTSMMQLNSMVMVASTLASGFTAIYALKKTQRRGTIIAAGAIGGVGASVIIAGIYIMLRRAPLVIFEDVAWAFGSSVIAGVLCVGTLSIWENLFDVATTPRLLELSNTNSPLLKQLMTEAPGTYHHSAMVAALSEAAAERIGADANLARVGAYYHDVGKLRRPHYFKENQRPGENIHDTLPPTESAQTIIAHQKDGVVLLTRHKLPSAVIQIAYEHHGNSLMAYFYHKAAIDGSQPNIKLFKYPGARPSSRESAIVMLADSCEAAVRSLGEGDREAVEAMVHKIFASKLEEGQLSNAPITLADITEIERSFLKTLSGIRHERIEYPDMAVAQKEL